MDNNNENLTTVNLDNINNIPTPQTEIPSTSHDIPVAGNIPTKKSKLPFIIIGIIVVIIIGVILKFTVFSDKGSSGGKKDTKFTKLTYDMVIPFQDGEKYGFIDVDGNVVIEAKYSSVKQIGNIFYAEDTEENKFDYIGLNGEIKLQKKPGSGYLYDGNGLWVIQNVVYNWKLEQVTKDSMEVESLSLNDNNAYFSYIDKENKKGGILDHEGKITYETSFDNEYRFKAEVGDKKFEDMPTYALIGVDDEIRLVNLDTQKIVTTYSREDVDSFYARGGNIFQFLYKAKDQEGYQLRKFIFVQDDEVKIETGPHSGNDQIDFNYSGLISVRQFTGNAFNDTYKYYNLCTKTLGEYDTTECGLKKYAYDFDDYSDYKIVDKKVMKGDQVVFDGSKYEVVDAYSFETYKYMSLNGYEYIMAQNKDKTWDVINLKNGEVVTTCEKGNASSIFCLKSAKDGINTYINVITGKEKELEANTTILLYTNYMTRGKSIYNKDFTEIYNK